MQTHPIVLALALCATAHLSAQTAPAISTNDNEIVALEPFVVNALTDERDRSVEAKRNADSIGDYLSTDRLGQFVDTNIGEVVERLPGVYTSGAGQSGGSGISIRGLGGGFNSLQLDGARLPSNQGGTRGVSIDNIPAELIGAIEIFKAPTPEKEADSIGGVVNVETKSGLDLKRRLITARASHGWDDYGDGFDSRGSFTYSDRLSDRVGVFFSLTRSENERLRDEIRADPGDYVFDQLVTTNPALPRITGADATRVFMPSRVDYRRTVQGQENTGANLNLDFQASDTWRLSLRTFFAQFDEQRPQIRNLWRFDRSTGNDPNNRTFPHAEYVYLDQSTGTFYFGNEQRIQRRVVDQNETEKISRVQLASVHRWPDATLDYSASFGRSSRDMVNDTFIFTADDMQLWASVRDLRTPSFDVIRPGEFFYNQNAKPDYPDFNSPASYGPDDDGFFSITERRAEVIDAKDEINTYAINYRRILTNGVTIKMGGLLRTQTKDNQRDFVINSGFAFNTANTSFAAQNGFFNGRQDLGLYPTYASLRTQNPVDPRTFTADVLGGTPSNDNRRDSTVQDLGADEDVLGLYAQASREFGRLTLLGGVRWERTESRYRGFTADVTGNPAIDTPRAVQGDRTYDDLYPSLHANFKLTERSLLRFAVGRTLARPEFEDLTPSSYATLGTDSDTGATIVNLQRGNANLRPTQSTNFDLSFEHYFANGGVFSIAAFHKELQDWIYQSVRVATPGDFPEYAAVPNLQSVRVNSSYNGDTAKIQGVELNLEKSLGWGFSAGANFTTLEFDVNRAQTGLDRVPGQTDRLIRVYLNYESSRFLARLGLRDSGNILDSQVSFSDPNAITYFRGQGMGQVTTDPNGNPIINLGLYDVGGTSLELTAEYKLSKHLRLFVQGNNLLSENPQAYLEERPQFAEKNEYRSWRAIVGLKLSL
ncbi:MAG: TonB-dependent receptor [Opitutaceae bacterium]|nr:TonB-dependent receptor [Opitutaceae bacterium]